MYHFFYFSFRFVSFPRFGSFKFVPIRLDSEQLRFRTTTKERTSLHPRSLLQQYYAPLHRIVAINHRGPGIKNRRRAPDPET